VVYGSTEAEPVASMSLPERLAVAGKGYCTGKPVEGLSARLVRITCEPLVFRTWAELDVPAGGIGELIVSGAHVCRDYFRNPEAVTGNKLIDGEGACWHRMGDTGYFDKAGRFWLTRAACRSSSRRIGTQCQSNSRPRCGQTVGDCRAGRGGAWLGRAASGFRNSGRPTDLHAHTAAARSAAPVQDRL